MSVKIAALTAALLMATSLFGRPAWAESAPSLDAFYARNPDQSLLVVLAFPSSSYLDWSSPSALARSSVQSTLSKRLMAHPSTIGHAQIAWRCQKPDGSWESGATGQSGEKNGQSLQALTAGWGMSILELVYTDGHLESEAEVEDRIRTGVNTAQFSWLGLKVPAQNCLRVSEFVKTYRAAGAAINYGFPVEPGRHEGGGCTSFANAALEKSGLNLPFRTGWVRNYQIPERYLGRSSTVPGFSAVVPQARIPQRPLYVPLSEFLFGDARWATDNEAAIRFAYYDPELFYESFIALENYLRAVKWQKPKPDRRTAELDSFQSRLRVLLGDWVKYLRQQGRPMEVQEIRGVSGAVIDVSLE
jgi:hypothetical protein